MKYIYLICSIVLLYILVSFSIGYKAQSIIKDKLSQYDGIDYQCSIESYNIGIFKSHIKASIVVPGGDKLYIDGDLLNGPLIFKDKPSNTKLLGLNITYPSIGLIYLDSNIISSKEGGENKLSVKLYIFVDVNGNARININSDKDISTSTLKINPFSIFNNIKFDTANIYVNDEKIKLNKTIVDSKANSLIIGFVHNPSAQIRKIKIDKAYINTSLISSDNYKYFKQEQVFSCKSMYANNKESFAKMDNVNVNGYFDALKQDAIEFGINILAQNIESNYISTQSQALNINNINIQVLASNIKKSPNNILLLNSYDINNNKVESINGLDLSNALIHINISNVLINNNPLDLNAKIKYKEIVKRINTLDYIDTIKLSLSANKALVEEILMEPELFNMANSLINNNFYKNNITPSKQSINLMLYLLKMAKIININGDNINFTYEYTKDYFNINGVNFPVKNLKR